MNWNGLLCGGILGFALGDGVVMIIIGSVIGFASELTLRHFDIIGLVLRGNASFEQVQFTSFSTTFSMMGHVAKADGVVTVHEISMAQSIMNKMKLDAKQREAAIGLFDAGKKSDFPVDEVLQQFKRECYRRNKFIRSLLENLARVALADGRLSEPQSHILRETANLLGYSKKQYQALLKRVRKELPKHDSNVHTNSVNKSSAELADAYKVLDVNSFDSDVVIKKAYRRQMNQHHPDKLVSKGLSEDGMEQANLRVQEIKNAHDTIKNSRKPEAF